MDVKQAQKELERAQARRENIIPLARSVTAECARAIRMVHVNKVGQAKKMRDKIKRDLKKLKSIAKKNHALEVLLSVPYQEYVELEVLLAFKEKRKVPSLHVAPDAYLLGTLDAIGEGKRVCMDLLAKRRVDEAGKLFDKMEEVYYSMHGLTFPKRLVSGLKPKQDAMRGVLERLHHSIAEARMRK